MKSDAACSMCNPRLGASICDFDEAWTISGLIATTPPFGQTQTMGLISLVNSWIASSLNTPTSCMDWRMDMFNGAPAGWVR